MAGLKYDYMTVPEMTLMIYEIEVHLNETICFGFDIRKKISLSDKSMQTWYALTLAYCEGVLVAVIVTDEETELESKVVRTKIELDEFVEDYCKRHNSKYTGKICVDMGSWDWHHNYI